MSDRLNELTVRWVADFGSDEWCPLYTSEMREMCELERLEIESLRQQLAAAEGLLREAVAVARAPDDDPERWYGNEIPNEWFDAAARAAGVQES
jgi:hypothetical protein